MMMIIIIIIIIQSATLYKASRHHFSQSHKPERLHFLEAELNSLSHGTDVASTQGIVCTKLPTTGKRWLLSFHHMRISSASSWHRISSDSALCTATDSSAEDCNSESLSNGVSFRLFGTGDIVSLFLLLVDVLLAVFYHRRLRKHLSIPSVLLLVLLFLEM